MEWKTRRISDGRAESSSRSRNSLRAAPFQALLPALIPSRSAPSQNQKDMACLEMGVDQPQ